MKNYGKQLRTLTWLLSAALVFIPIALQAQPAAIPISDLTDEQFKDLPDAQAVIADQDMTTLGDLRAQQESARSRHAAWVEESAARTRQKLDEIEEQRSRAAAAQARATNAEVDQIVAHFKRQAEENPELVRRAESTVRKREELHELWIKSTRVDSERQVHRIQKEARKIQRRRN